MKKLTVNPVIFFSGILLIFTIEAKAQKQVAHQNSRDSLSKNIIGLYGKAQNNTISLTWGTISESDNESFHIQRSKNCMDWENIGSIKGTGGSLWPVSYCWVDTNINEAVYFYRLLINNDAQFEYSNSITIQSNSPSDEKSKYEVYPNPSRNTVWIKSLQPLNNENLFNLEVYNVKGEQIYNARLRDNPQRIDLSDYKKGYYYIKINTETYRIYKD